MDYSYSFIAGFNQDCPTPFRQTLLSHHLKLSKSKAFAAQ
jgi:hypothetical protein